MAKQEASFTSDEVKELIAGMLEANKESNRAFAQELLHPAPTVEQREQQKRNWEARVEQARLDDEGKARKRKYCGHLANPGMPHRRPHDLATSGVHGGESLIQWQYTTRSYKDEQGNRRESEQIAIGVCKWCQTVFTPDDPDYMEALSWGGSSVAGTHPMNIRTGNWA